MALYGILYRMLLKNYIRRNRGKNEKIICTDCEIRYRRLHQLTGLIVLNLVMALTSSSYFEMASLVGSVAGFTVSVIANYILSFKFVFERKEDLNKKVEFITFVVLSLIGMLLNSFLIWIVVGPIYRGSTALQQHIGYNLIYTIAKVFATAVVMVYNFITRKIFLEKK